MDDILFYDQLLESAWQVSLIGRRFLYHLAKINQSNNQDMVNEKSHPCHLKWAKMEADLFILKTRDFLRELDRTIEAIPSIKDSLVNIKNHIPHKDINNLRNMHQHLEEYERGCGHKQEEFIYSDPSGLYSLDASSTIILNGVYLYGGRLDMQELCRTMNSIFIALSNGRTKVFGYPHNIYTPDNLLLYTSNHKFF